MTSNIFNFSVRPAVVSSVGTLSGNTFVPPPVLTEENLIELAKVNDAFVRLNRKSASSLMDYLTHAANSFKDDSWFEELEDFALLLSKISDDGYEIKDDKFDLEHLEDWLGEKTDFLHTAFTKIQKHFSWQDVPAHYMSFMLHKAGQPILSGTKLGWRHTCEFNG